MNKDDVADLQLMEVDSVRVGNKFGEIILSLSSNHPIAYGFFSIILVILFGIFFSYAREFIHYVRYDLDKKKYSFFK